MFWQRAPRTRWRWAGLITAVALGVAGVGSCTAAVVVAGSCAFDPPPGDTGELRVVDDGPQPVTVFRCADARCTSGGDAEQVAAGGELVTQFELCDGGSVAITDSGGFLQGCQALPVGEERSAVTVRASQFARGCAKDGALRPHIS